MTIAHSKEQKIHLVKSVERQSYWSPFEKKTIVEEPRKSGGGDGIRTHDTG